MLPKERLRPSVLILCNFETDRSILVVSLNLSKLLVEDPRVHLCNKITRLYKVAYFHSHFEDFAGGPRFNLNNRDGLQHTNCFDTHDDIPDCADGYRQFTKTIVFFHRDVDLVGIPSTDP